MKIKLKSCRAALKRIKLKNKKIYRKSAFKSHLLGHKSNKRLRYLSKIKQLNKTNKKSFIKMLPYLY